MVEVQILNNQEEVILDDKLIQDVKITVIKVSEILNINNKSISIVFIDKKTIQELNKSYRNKDYATDVLSFPLSDVNSEEQVLGELIISAAVAVSQADEYGNTLAEEINFLVIHGLLHLIGYDHDDDHKGEMREKEKEVISLLSKN